MKALITDPTQVVESKGIDSYEVKNCKRIAFSSNEDKLVSADIDDRRYVITNVNPRFKGDWGFFSQLRGQMDDKGGIEALMYELVNEDLTDWHPRQKPRNKWVFDIKIEDMKPAHRWLYECLKNRCYMVDEYDDPYEREWLDEPEYKSKKRLYKGFVYYSKNMLKIKKIESDAAFWKRIKDVLPVLNEVWKGAQKLVQLPALQEARAAFEKLTEVAPEELWGE